MSTDFEHDVRTTLARRAGDVRVRDEDGAWDAIAARLDEPPGSSRKLVTFAGGLVAAALIVVAVFVARHDDTTTPRVPMLGASTTTTVSPVEPLPPHVWEGEPGQDAGAVIGAYLMNRMGTEISAVPSVVSGPNVVRATFLSRDVATEVFARKVGERWFVISAASDLVPIHEPTFDGTMTIAIVTPESDGTLMTAFGDEDWDGPHDVQAGESVPVRRAGQGSVRAVLRTSDGTVGLSEVMPTLSPVSVARDFVENGLRLLVDVPISFGDFQQGDTRSGEIPYSIDVEGGAGGQILLREDASDSWKVIGITSDTLAVHVEKVEKGTNVMVSELDANDVTVHLDSFYLTLRPGQSTTISRGTPHTVRAVAHKDGKVVAIFYNPLD